MELEVLNVRGIPQSGVLSISAGGMRKQVQLSAVDKPIRFTGKTDDISQIKVDVLDVLGRARLAYHPSEQKYTLPLESVNGETTVGEMDIVVRPSSSETPSGLTNENDEFDRRKEMDANGYLEEHGLVNFMQFLLTRLMQDKPADPYPFLQKQIATRLSATGSSLTSPVGGTGIPPLSTLPDSTLPLLTVPALQDTDLEVTTLLERLSPSAVSPQGVGYDDIMNLEKEAEEARKRLLADNQSLRDTATQMNSEYEKLMQESASLHDKLNAKNAAKKDGKTQEAYREIEKLQNEVRQLARDNAQLVAKLSRGREMIDLVRQDMLEIQRRCNE